MEVNVTQVLATYPLKGQGCDKFYTRQNKLKNKVFHVHVMKVYRGVETELHSNLSITGTSVVNLTTQRSNTGPYSEWNRHCTDHAT
jgi:hypothetical protein